MTEELACCSAGIVRLFFVVFCPIAGLHLSKSKFQNRTASFLSASWPSVKEGPNKTPYRNILFEAVFGKVFCTNGRMLWGHKTIPLFIFISHSLYVLDLGGTWKCNFGFPLKFTVNLKPKQFRIFRFSWSHQQGRHKFFSTALRLWGIKISDFNIPISPKCFVQFLWNFRICSLNTYWTYWTQMKKRSKFWFIWL